MNPNIPELPNLAELTPAEALIIFEQRVKAVCEIGAATTRNAAYALVRTLYPDLYTVALPIMDARIRQKMSAGLNREQAEAAVAQQDAEDARQ